MMVELYSLRIKSTQRDIQVSQTIFDIKGENMQIFAKKGEKDKERTHTGTIQFAAFCIYISILCIYL